MAQHWHVIRHADDEEPYITADAGAAFDYAARELDHAADFEHDGIRAAGDAGDFEGAFRAWEREQELSAAQANAANIAAQYAAEDEGDRAPLYQGPGWEARLATAAQSVAQEASRAGALGMWSCGMPICPVDNDDDAAPEMFTADRVRVTDRLRVINSDMRWGHVVLSDDRYPPQLENGEWWFCMLVDGHDRLTMVSESRVATRAPR